MLSTIGVDYAALWSYQNPDNFKSWRSCSFQSYLTSERHYTPCQLSRLKTKFSVLLKSWQQWELTFLRTVTLIATKISTTLRVEVPMTFRATWHLEDTMLPFNYQSWQRGFQSYLKIEDPMLPGNFLSWKP